MYSISNKGVEIKNECFKQSVSNFVMVLIHLGIIAQVQWAMSEKSGWK